MENQAVTMVCSGDLHIRRSEPESIFEFTRSYLKSADLFFGNLEACVTDTTRQSEAKESAGMLFKSEERMFPAYVHAGLGACGLANNHSMNYGMEGMDRTLGLLDSAGIAHTGAGKDLNDAHRPGIVERKGNKIAFLSYSSVFVPPFAAQKERGGIAVVRISTHIVPHPRHFEVPGSPPTIALVPNAQDVAALVDDIKKAKQVADIVVVSWHWGLSAASGGGGQLVSYQTELSRVVIDAGADLLLGHHPHVLQPIEIYKGKAIFYSLGNWAFDLFYGHKGQTTGLARCIIENGAIQEVAFVPAFINETAQPSIADTTTGSGIVHHMQTISEPFGTKFQVREKEIVVDTGAAAAVAAG